MGERIQIGDIVRSRYDGADGPYRVVEIDGQTAWLTDEGDEFAESASDCGLAVDCDDLEVVEAVR